MNQQARQIFQPRRGGKTASDTVSELCNSFRRLGRTRHGEKFHFPVRVFPRSESATRFLPKHTARRWVLKTHERPRGVSHLTLFLG